MLPKLLLTAATLVASASAVSTNASTEIFPLTWFITSLNGQQLLPNSTGRPHYSYIAFAFTDVIYRNIVQCHRQLPKGNTKTPIADGKYYPCEGGNVSFALAQSKDSKSGFALGLKYAFEDPLGVFTTDCGTVNAASLGGYYALDGAYVANYASGASIDAGQVFIPFAYNETVAGKGTCKPGRLGGPY